MPIYEYLCPNCDRRFSFLVRKIGAPVTSRCPDCGTKGLERLVSTLAYHRSFRTIREGSGGVPESFDTDYYKDPRNIGRWAEKRAKELGVSLPSEVQKDIRAAREGILPQSMADEL